MKINDLIIGSYQIIFSVPVVAFSLIVYKTKQIAIAVFALFSGTQAIRSDALQASSIKNFSPQKPFKSVSNFSSNSTSTSVQQTSVQTDSYGHKESVVSIKLQNVCVENVTIKNMDGRTTIIGKNLIGQQLPRQKQVTQLLYPSKQEC